MGILLILAQIALVILAPVAHIVTLNLWVVFLPAMLFGALWLIGIICGCRLVVDRFTNIYTTRPRKR